MMLVLISVFPKKSSQDYSSPVAIRPTCGLQLITLIILCEHFALRLRDDQEQRWIGDWGSLREGSVTGPAWCLKKASVPHSAILLVSKLLRFDIIRRHGWNFLCNIVAAPFYTFCPFVLLVLVLVILSSCLLKCAIELGWNPAFQL